MSININNISPPKNPIPKASNFADWVFRNSSYYREPVNHEQKKRKYEKMRQGLVDHRAIDLFFRHKWTLDNLERANSSEWDLISADSHVYKSSCLKINSKPMYCKPDVVLQNKISKSILIIERKTTSVPQEYIPKNGWPNIQAQLWCYSWIDKWYKAPDILLVAQIWHRTYKPKGGYALELNKNIGSLWKRSDKKHNKFCHELFKAYGGKFIQQ